MAGSGMAKSTTKKEENGSKSKPEPQAQPVQPQAQPSLSVLAQYIKDFSFENPNSPTSLRPRDKSPEININVNVSANALTQNDFEVVLQIDARAADAGASDTKGIVFNAELSYAGIFRIQNVPQEALQPALLIECPRLLFPFARQIISDASRNGGFPPLMIDPIDFSRLFQQRMAEQARAKAPN
jgi:preprotein translocase subunit SecB